MEDDAKEFLAKIVRSLTIGLLWLMINMTLGIYNELLIFEGRPSIGNIIFYIWFVVSLAYMIRMFIRLWGAPKPEEPTMRSPDH